MSENEGETIDGGAPYEFDKETPVLPVAEGVDLVGVTHEADNEPANEAILATPGAEIDDSSVMAKIGENQPPGYLDEMAAGTSEAEHAGLDPETQQARMTESRTIAPLGGPATMSKRRVVLNFQTKTASLAYFGDEDGQDGCHMPLDVWEDLGSPTVITLGVVPRDILNLQG